MRNPTVTQYSAKMLLRYRVVSEVRMLALRGMKLSRALDVISAREHLDDRGGSHRYCRRTIQRWLERFTQGSIEGLRDRSRARCESSTVLDQELLDFLATEKQADPQASIPELIRRARLVGVLHPAAAVDRTTVWRGLQRMGVPTRRPRVQELVADDKRRFAYQERMQMLMADFVHFRAGPKRARRVAVYFLDDATRFGLTVVVGTGGEKAIYCLRGLEEILRRYGTMSMVYLDHGPAFANAEVAHVLGQLNVALVHGRRRYPQGHGKAEKYNQGARARILRSLDGAEYVDPDPAALTLRLRHDLYEVYNHLPHSSLNGDSPYMRWTASSRPLRPLESTEQLRLAFRVPVQRVVKNDNCISVAGTNYEVPPGLARKRVTVHRALLEDDALYLQHAGKAIRLHPVDTAFNATCGRSLRRQLETEHKAARKTASTLSFELEYDSLLDRDGGFRDAPETCED